MPGKSTEYITSVLYTEQKEPLYQKGSQKENRIGVNEMTQWVKLDDSVGLPHKPNDLRSIPELGGKKNQTPTRCPLISTYTLWHANAQAHNQNKCH